MTQPQRVLILGGGYVGMYTALHLQRAFRSRRRFRAARAPEAARVPEPPRADGATAPVPAPAGAPDVQAAGPAPRRDGAPGDPHRGTAPGAPRRRSDAPELVVVEPQSYMTYQPFLPEAAAGSISPRHVVVPLRRVLPHARVITGEVVAADPEHRTATIATRATTEDGEPELRLRYDALVVATGSVARVLPVPGLAEHGIGFKTVEEAIGLRNHILQQLDVAASTRDPEVREAALTFVFVGAGYAGVEALAELEDMARHAVRHHTTVAAADLRWVLVDAADRILPEAGPRLADYVLAELRRRGVDIRLTTRLASAGPGTATLTDGTALPTRTLVWTAGVRPHPVLARLGLPLDADGRLPVTPELHTADHPDVFAAGDCAAVPDLTAADGARCAPNAQHAVRQARTVADNVLAHLTGRPPTPYRHRSTGAVTSLGLHKGAVHVRGLKARGYPAWVVHRVHHLARMPTANRKTRVLTEWLLSGLLSRDTVSLGSPSRPPAPPPGAAAPRAPRPPRAD